MGTYRTCLLLQAKKATISPAIKVNITMSHALFYRSWEINSPGISLEMPAQLSLSTDRSLKLIVRHWSKGRLRQLLASISLTQLTSNSSAWPKHASMLPGLTALHGRSHASILPGLTAPELSTQEAGTICEVRSDSKARSHQPDLHHSNPSGCYLVLQLLSC